MNETPDDPEADNRLALLIRDSVADRTLPTGFSARLAAAAGAAAASRRRRRRAAVLAAFALVLAAAAAAFAATGRGETVSGAGRAVARRTDGAPGEAVGAAPLAGVVDAVRRRRRRSRQESGNDAEND